MSDPNVPPPPGGGGQTPPPPGGAPPPPGQGAFNPPPAGGPPPPGSGGFQPPAQPYQPSMSSGVAGPGGTVLAEAWKRIVALLIDSIGLSIVVGIPVSVITGASSWSTSYGDLDIMWWLGVFLTPVLYYLYYALMIGTRGQTVAGMLLKIKVIDQNGGPVTQAAAWKRQAWGLLNIIPCLGSLAQLALVIWGLVNLFNDPMRQTPWDKFGETVVVDA